MAEELLNENKIAIDHAEIYRLMTSVSVGDFNVEYEVPEIEDEFTIYRVMVKLMLDTIKDKLLILKKSQEVLEITNKNLNESYTAVNDINDRLRDFNYMLSHDLKSPFLALEGLIDLLIKEINDPAIQPLLDHSKSRVENIQQQLAHLDHTLQDILNDTDRMEDISLEDCFRHTLKLCGHLLPLINFDLKIDFQNRNPFWYSKSESISLFQNLLVNSIKYRDSIRHLTVKVKCEDVHGGVLIEFSDTGRGFDSEKHGKEIFEKRKRIHTDVEGSGIGLYVIKKQIERHSGFIKVESTENVGTKFTIFLKSYSKE